MRVEAISSILVKLEMAKHIHLQMGFFLTFDMENLLASELLLTMSISYLLSKLRNNQIAKKFLYQMTTSFHIW